MKPASVLIALQVLIFAVYSLVTVGFQENESVLLITGDVGFVLLAFNASLIAFIAFLNVPRAQERLGWLLTAVAFSSFAVGDFIWAYFELVKGVEVPVGSWPDVFWTVAYVVWAGALACCMMSMFFKSRVAVAGAIGVSFIALVSFIFYAFKFAQGLGHGFEDIVNTSYIVYDIILLSGVSLLIGSLRSVKNPLVKVWFLFGSAVLVRVVFDFGFLALVAADSYSTGNYVDLLYGASYVLLAFAAFQKVRVTEFLRGALWRSR